MGWGPFQYAIMPESASKHAPYYDALFWTITGLAAVFTILVIALLVFFASKYRRGTKADRRNILTHHTGLELVWMGVPLVLAIGMFVWSSSNFIKVRTIPKDAVEVFCIGKKWMWHFEHMNGTRENNELHIVVGQPIKITMISQDVVHALYFPEMRAQYHVVPGRYTELQFTPTKTGRFKILCAMHCGTQHSEMVGQLYVMTPTEYAEWLEKGGNKYKTKPLTVVEAGRQTFSEKRCDNCHTGANNERAPSLVGIFGKERLIADGTKAIADLDYIREAIKMPHNRLTKGFEDTMPVYSGTLTELQVIHLAEYIKSLTPGQGDFKNADITKSIPGSDSNSSAVDVANQSQSAGNSQFRTSEGRR
jgi:cytochrome c oxidase subunit 2